MLIFCWDTGRYYKYFLPASGSSFHFVFCQKIYKPPNCSPKVLYQLPFWLYSLQPKMEKLHTINKNKTWSWLWPRSWAPYCQIRLKLKKVGKTTRPFRYDLNQILYDYTVEVTNRFKGLYLVERVPENGWWFGTLYRRQWPKPSPRKRNAKWQNGCLRRQITEKRREAKGTWKWKIYPSECRVPKGRKKDFPSKLCKKNRRNNRMGKTRDLFKKIKDKRWTFHENMGTVNDRKDMDLTEAEDKKRWQEYTEELYKKRS